MTLNILTADEILAQWNNFDTIIDARSEAEFEQDHLPGAINWPTLNNTQRQEIGTIYKQVSTFEAKKRGAAIAAYNIASHIEREVIDKSRDWRPLTYCWRGGKRSGSLSLVLDQIGFRVSIIEGGYKAFRAAILKAIPELIEKIHFNVICGTTGSGKTRLLQALQTVGAQVLDLEALASHRSSVLGAIPDNPQPTQKHFDTLVWDALRHIDPNRPVYVESESKKIGNVSVPLALIEKMRASPCLNVFLPVQERVALLLEDYQHLAKDPTKFCERLDILASIVGTSTINTWKRNIQNEDLNTVVEALLSEHYDPVYMKSMQRNFQHYSKAKQIFPHSHSMQAMLDVAKTLVQ